MKNQIQAFKNDEEKIERPKELQNNDIYVTKTEIKEEYNEAGQKITTFIKRKVNLTKKINETAKLLKIDTLQSKYDKLKEIIEKGE